MSTQRLAVRRLATALGVVAVLAIGFGSIKAAAAWTADSAPLTVTPVSVATLQARLNDEHVRSEAVTQQLLELETRALELEAALLQANARVGADATHATDLEAQLTDASGKLERLEVAIAKAKDQLAAQIAAARGVRTAGSGSTTSAATDDHDDEDHEEHDEDDEHEADDDD
jgi:hypothetical protein